MRVFKQTLAANEVWENPGGLYFHIIEAVSDVDVQFYSTSGMIDEFAQGVGVGYRTFRDDGEGFTKVDIKNGVTPQTIKIVISENKGDYNIIAGQVVAILPKSTFVQAYADYTIAPGTKWGFGSATSVKKTYYTNQGTSIVRWGDALVGPNTGGIIYPGETIEIETIATIYFYNTGIANAVISRVSIED